jgi:hypothetical protein
MRMPKLNSVRTHLILNLPAPPNQSSLLALSMLASSSPRVIKCNHSPPTTEIPHLSANIHLSPAKSKKQRRLAAKRQRAAQARLLAEGNLAALAPKIPVQQQTINLPGNEDGTPEGALAAVAAREELRQAMRKERKAKIKESNYLKSM